MKTITIDAKGEDCPIPLMKLKESLKNAIIEDVLEIEFTCPEAVNSIPRFLEKNGHEILSFEQLKNKAWKIIIKKKK